MSGPDKEVESEVGSSEFERRTRALLLESAERLPGSVRSRLTQARYAALAAQSSQRSPWSPVWHWRCSSYSRRMAADLCGWP
jgi:hypothetical protein